MKAAVVYQKGEMPQCIEFPEPQINNDNECLLTVKAAAIKHFDKASASGKHYSANANQQIATVIGGDGVGLLADGTRVFAFGRGMIAEKAVVEKSRMIRLPDAIDDASAAALPNAVAGSAMALRFRAAMKGGETLLINGATSFTGKIALQLAKFYGAHRIIVTGRNEQTLRSLLVLGANEIVSLNQSDEDFIAQIKKIHNDTPIDIILDYLWGRTAECILAALKGKGLYTHPTRFVSIGAVTGDIIQLSAENLRSVDLRLSGSGLGSWTKEQMQQLFSQILPQTFALAAENKLKLDTEKVKLENIEKLWGIKWSGGKRLVVTI